MSYHQPPNPMRDQVASLPNLIEEQVWILEERTRKILTTPEIFAVRQILLTGCGDSHICGLTAETTFETLTEIPTQALNAMQAARYKASQMRRRYPHTPLVIAVSNSGEVARVVEAVKTYGEKGALTLGITSNPHSRLATQASRIVPMTVPSFPSAPGVRSYVISLLTLYLIAIRMGEVRGTYTADHASTLRRELAATAETIRGVIEVVDAPLRQLAADWREFSNFELLGSGAERGAAAYGAAKLLEAVGVHALHEDIEEWVHLEYFVSQARTTGTFVLCPDSSPAFSRVIEIEPLLQTLQRPYLVLTGDVYANRFKHALSVGVNVHPLFAPLVYSVPVALFAAYLAAELGQVYGRGAQGQWVDSKDGMTTRQSTIV